MTDLMINNTKNLLEAIVDESTKPNGTVDIYLLLHRYATDVIAEFTYGPSGATRSLVDPKFRHVAEQFALSDRRFYQLCQIHLPSITSLYTQIVNILAPDKKIGVLEYGWLAVQEMKKEKFVDAEESIAGLMMSYRNEQFSDAYIASELLDHLVSPMNEFRSLTEQIAGSDTTANTLTYLLYELSRPENHSYQERLHNEIISLGIISPSVANIDKLRVVDAVLREGLRVFSAIPFLEPREVPKGGRLLHSFYLPEQVLSLYVRIS
jgi:hypothetical protein